MSSTRQAVTPAESFTGFGNRPVLQPCHQQLLLIGMGPFGAKIEEIRTKPNCGSEFVDIAAVSMFR